jgi:translation initiation factor 2 subunit 3
VARKKQKQKLKEEKKSKSEGKLLPEMNIGMVGHVDHGKTTLTEALTGKWTDTHSEEIKRGITIRIGYADATFYKCSKCKGYDAYGTSKKCIKCFSDCVPIKTVSFVDAPGHETLMATVLSGAALMDGALLLISAAEKCPQPQTREHLNALEIVGIKNIVVVQNKIDLVTEERVRESYKEIKDFLNGTIAENAPIIPVSAQQRINIDALIQAIIEYIPTPKRDPNKPAKMLVARSFDVNKPGTEIKDLKGGVLGGSLVQGKLRVGDVVEIRPGVKIKDKFEPIRTEITGLQKAGQDINEATPGGLLGVQTKLDPSLTKSDGLGGNVLGKPETLPPIIVDIRIRSNLFEKVVGMKEEHKLEKLKTGDVLMLTAGITRTVGLITSVSDSELGIKLKIPICAEKGEKVSISKQIMGRWRLIGWGEII